MRRVVVLDSGPLGLLTYSRSLAEANACNDWLQRHLSLGSMVVVPEIADYELRRELLRTGLMQGILRLETLLTVDGIDYLPISTPAMRLAAEYWAQARRAGRPTADPKALDADVILAAQASLIPGADDMIVATTNVDHLARFVPAAAWRDIEPLGSID